MAGFDLHHHQRLAMDHDQIDFHSVEFIIACFKRITKPKQVLQGVGFAPFAEHIVLHVGISLCHQNEIKPNLPLSLQ